MSNKPYDEPQIIALITEYYHLLFLLNYITPHDIDSPPPEGREIDETLCQSLNLTPEVISLMRHIPCPISEGLMLEHELLIPMSHANSFVDSNLIEVGRDPELGENKWFLKSTDVALSIMGDEGQYLVLDTAKNTLRVCTWEPPNSPEDEDEPGLCYDFHPNSPSDHYTRFPVHDPVEYLQSCIDKVRSLEWLPMRVYSRGVISTNGPGRQEEYCSMRSYTRMLSTVEIWKRRDDAQGSGSLSGPSMYAPA
ncbi:hypothetical protein QM012_003212 [Aureobasidium pullulans]|uniref:Uncharacterized protein n=1 Tax=Aureobasidium pullulans TaxID=5580 RepID=A0ABR0T9K5_AURPU